MALRETFWRIGLVAAGVGALVGVGLLAAGGGGEPVREGRDGSALRAQTARPAVEAHFMRESYQRGASANPVVDTPLPGATAQVFRNGTGGGRISTASAEDDTADARAPDRRCALRLPARFPNRRVVVPILMYHRINVVTRSTPAISRALTVHPADFARQMRWLKRHGYSTVTQRELFDALMCGRPLGRQPIMITFDDGYRDAFFKASPVLARLGMRATAYVVSGRISGRDPNFLTWPLLHALERRGIEIGSHTVAHRDLTSLSDAEMLEDLTSSRRALERRLLHPVPWLAYPFGAYDERVERLARRAGYLLAVTTQPEAVQSARQPLALPRLRVLDSTGVRGLAAMLAAFAPKGGSAG
jgi:peptidoglycan/xylan/chitin deacetylase (PgdA/CDA1 family)